MQRFFTRGGVARSKHKLTQAIRQLRAARMCHATACDLYHGWWNVLAAIRHISGVWFTLLYARGWVSVMHVWGYAPPLLPPHTWTNTRSVSLHNERRH